MRGDRQLATTSRGSRLIGRFRSICTISSVSAGSSVGQVLGRVGLELFEEDAIGGDLAQRLPVGRARHGDGDGQRSAVARQADHPHVVAEVLATELRADVERAGQFQDLLLGLGVADRVAGHRPFGGQGVQVAGAGVLRGLEGVLGAGAADDHSQVIRRAGSRAQLAQLLVEEPHECLGVQHRLGLLVQEGLVGRTATLGHDQELVGQASWGAVAAYRSIWAGRLVPVFLSSHIVKGAIWE